MDEIGWDAFISHASEDKREVVIPLSRLLAASGLKIWLDEGEIFVGDSLREKIDAGLGKSQFGIVILSPHFFSKDWPKSELDGLFAKEIGSGKVILPVWHNIDYEDIKKYSPLLAGRMAANTDHGLNKVKDDILQAIYQVGRQLSIGKPVYSGRLTKKQLMKFPEGGYLVSNSYSSFDRRPLVEEQIGSLEDRDKLWEKVKRVGADGRLCYVLKNYNDYRHHMDTLAMWLGFQRSEK